MEKRLLCLLLPLCLLCSCGTPGPEPSTPATSATLTPEPTESLPLVSPISTVIPIPEPTLSLAPDWVGKGISHASDALGLTLELPPEWAEWVTFTERISEEGFLRNWDGRVPCVSIDYAPNGGEHAPEEESGAAGGPLPVLDPSEPMAYFYWLPEGQHGPEADYGNAVTLLEKETGRWVCHLPMNTIQFDNAEYGRDTPEWIAYHTVEQGLLEGNFVAQELEDPFAWTHVVNPWVEDDRAVVAGLGHIPLDTLPQEVLDSLDLVEEGPWEGMYRPEECVRRVYTAPGLELVTTAPTAAYLEYKAESDKDNRDLYSTEADFWADVEGEEGREWILRAIITDDSYSTRYDLKVGLTVAEAKELGYPVVTRKDYGAYEKLVVTVENGVITAMEVYPLLGRYIGKFFEM